MVLDGRKGDDGSGTWINTLYLVVNGLTDKDFLKVSSYSNYGSNALHPVVADEAWLVYRFTAQLASLQVLLV